MAQLSILRNYVRDELGEMTAGRWSDPQLNSWLNRGVDYLVAEYKRTKCWDLLQSIARTVDYTLTIGQDTYSVYDILLTANSEVQYDYNLSYYGFIRAQLGNYLCEKLSIEEYHRAIANGEYNATTSEPKIIFYGADKTEGFLSFITGVVEPMEDEKIIGGTSAAEAYIAKTPTVDTGSWGSNAAGSLWLYRQTGTFSAAESLTICRDVTCSEFAVNGATDTVAQNHGKVPFVIIKPTPTSASTLSFWWLREPVLMVENDDIPYVDNSDELLILYATARAWKADRNFDMHRQYLLEFNQELQKKMANYSEPVFQAVPFVSR